MQGSGHCWLPHALPAQSLAALLLLLMRVLGVVRWGLEHPAAALLPECPGAPEGALKGMRTGTLEY